MKLWKSTAKPKDIEAEVEEVVLPPLREVMDEQNIGFLMQQIVKTRCPANDDTVSYSPVEYKFKDTTYVVQAIHVPIEDVAKYGQSSCKKCSYGKGYVIANVLKTSIPDPQNYVVMAKVPIRKFSPEQQKIWIEKEKLNPMLRIMLPCECALKWVGRRDPNLVSNVEGNIMFRLSYKVKD